LLLRLVLLLALAGVSHLTVATAVVAQCLAGIVSNSSQLVLAVRHLGGLGGALRSWRPRTSFRRLRRHRGILLSNIGLSASDLMNKDLDVTLLAPMLPATQIGTYKMAKNIALLAWRAVDPFYIALMPELSRLIALRDYARTSRLLVRSAVGLAALAAGVSLCLYAAVRFFGERLLGPAFGDVPSIMAWLIVGIVASAPLVWGHPFAVALNRAHLAFLGTLFGSTLGLCAFLALAPYFGVAGAAVAWSLTLTSGFVFTAVATLRALKQHRAIHSPSTPPETVMIPPSQN
jgi:O-antigen/teichoic acid export membrane protein